MRACVRACACVPQDLIAELAAALPPLAASSAGDDPRVSAWLSYAHGIAGLASGHGASGRAEALLTDAARLLPEHAAVWLGLAEVAWQGGDHASAGRLAAKAADAVSAPPVPVSDSPSCPAAGDGATRRGSSSSFSSSSAWPLLNATHRRLSDAIVLQSAAARRVEGGGSGLALADAAVRASEAGPAGALGAEPAAWGCKGTAHLAAFFASEGPGDGSTHLDEAKRAYGMAAALADGEAKRAGESAAALGPAAEGSHTHSGATTRTAVANGVAAAAGPALSAGVPARCQAAEADSPAPAGSLRDAALCRRSRMFPDVLANRGACLALCMEVAAAARCFASAHTLDPTLGAMASLAGMARMVTSVARGVAARGHLDQRKLAQRVSAWPKESVIEEWLAQDDDEGGAGGRALVRDAVAAVASLGAPERAGSRSLTLAGQTVLLLPLGVVSSAGETPSVVACLDRAGNRVALALYRSAGGASLSRICRPGMWVAVTDPELAWVAANPAELAEPASGCSFEAASAVAGPAAASASAALPRVKAARKGGKPGKRARPAAAAQVPQTADGVLVAAEGLRFLVVRALGPSHLRVSGMTGVAAGIGSGAKSVLCVGSASH